jgi:transposase-like protein
MRTVCGGLVLDALVQGREGRRAAQKLAAEKLLRKLIRTQSRTPRVMVTDSPGKERAPADAVPQEDQEASVQIRPIPEAPRPGG